MIAVEEANAIIFMVDAATGITEPGYLHGRCFAPQHQTRFFSCCQRINQSGFWKPVNFTAWGLKIFFHLFRSSVQVPAKF